MSKKNYNRLPLDLPTPKTRRRREFNKDRIRDSYNTEGNVSPIFGKTLLALIIIIVVMIAKNTNSDFSQKMVGYLRHGITEDMDIDEALGKLKFVNNYLADAKAVFGVQEQDKISDEEDMVSNEGEIAFAIPAEGKVTSFFDTDNSGIYIIGEDNAKVYAASRGKVISTGENHKGEKHIKVSHSANLVSLYEGCSEVHVQVGDSLEQGEVIGTMGQDSSGLYGLHFEVWSNGKPIDPLGIIKSNSD